LIENLSDVGKKKVPLVQAPIEPDLVYPLLRGRDVDRWRARPSAYILVVQDPVKRVGYDESWLRVSLPHTYAYLKRFEKNLRRERRSGAVRALMEKGAFYSMYAVAEYTFAPYKVVWREQAADFTAAVAEAADLPAVPDHKLMLVECAASNESHYVCAALNSAPVRLLVKSYAVETQTSTHVLAHVALPKFDQLNTVHRRLSRFSQKAHQLGAKGIEGLNRLREVEREIDELAARLWGITHLELEEIRHSLEDL
jgi:hypothetical protein